MKDYDENRRAFLLAAYSDKIDVASRLRDRAFNLTRNFVLGSFALSGFVIATPNIELSPFHRAIGVVVVLAVTLLSAHLVTSSYKVLYSVLKITARLEVAMGFHEPGIYLDERLYPELTASEDKLADGLYDKGSERRYLIAVLLSGVIASLAFVIL